MNKFEPGMVEVIVKEIEKKEMVNYAENFFRRMDAQKEREVEIRIDSQVKAMRKVYRKIKPYMRKVAIKFIVCSDNPNGTHVFKTKSFRKAKNEWIRLRCDCDWYSIFAINRNDFKWRVHWYCDEYNREKIIKFFGNDGEEVYETLTNLTEWGKDKDN